jgi:hypothetical protein
MIVTYIRSSSYSNYDFCGMQYFMTYVLGHSSGSGKKAELGTMVHKVMEVLAALRKFQQDNPKRKTLEIVDDAVGKVKVHVDKLNTDEFVEEMVELSYESYKANSTHRWMPADRKAATKLSFVCVEHSNGLYDPRKRDVVDPEPHFDLVIDEPWATFEYEDKEGKKVVGQLAIKGTIDLVTKVSDDVIEVIDWKTGMRKDWNTGEVKTIEKLKHDPQLLLYHYAISRLYPEFSQAIMTIFFVKDGGPFSLCFDETDKKKFLYMLKMQFNRIKNDQSPRPLSRDQSNWKCTRLCHFYKTNWKGTEDNMCSHVLHQLDTVGMDETVRTCSKPGFSIGHYEAPG